MTTPGTMTPTTADGTPARADGRPIPWLHQALAAGGGLLLALGAVVLGVDLGTGDEFNRWPLVVIAAVLLGLAFVGTQLLADHLLGPSVAAAGTAIVATIVPVELSVLILWKSPSSSSVRAFCAVTIIAFVVLFVVPPFRRRPVLLFGAAFTAWFWGLYEVQASSSSRSSLVSSRSLSVGDSGSEIATKFALVSLAFGLAYLALMWWLDRRGQARAGTAFVPSSFAALVYGVFAVSEASGHVWAAGMVAIGVGLLAMVAGAGRRRFTTWGGAAFVTVGALVVIGDLTDTVTRKGAQFSGDSSPKVFSTLAMLVGIALIAGATGLSRVLNEGGGPASASPGPPAPTPPPTSGTTGTTETVPEVAPAVVASVAAAAPGAASSEATVPAPESTTTWAPAPVPAPAPSAPEPSAPEPSVPEPSVPEPSVPEPSVPEPSVPEPSAPEPSVPASPAPASPAPAPPAPAPEPPAAPAPPAPPDPGTA